MKMVWFGFQLGQAATPGQFLVRRPIGVKWIYGFAVQFPPESIASHGQEGVHEPAICPGQIQGRVGAVGSQARAKAQRKSAVRGGMPRPSVACSLALRNSNLDQLCGLGVCRGDLGKSVIQR